MNQQTTIGHSKGGSVEYPFNPFYGHAERILGGDFIPPELIWKVYNERPYLAYTSDQFTLFRSTLPPPAELERIRRNNMVLIAGFARAMTFNLIRDHYLHYCARRSGWVEGEMFAQSEQTHADWIAFPKDVIRGSLNENWATQSQLVPASETVPNAADVVRCLGLFRKVRNACLLQNTFVRTSSRDSRGRQICVGSGVDGTIHIFAENNRFALPGLGILGVRKYSRVNS